MQPDDSGGAGNCFRHSRLLNVDRATLYHALSKIEKQEMGKEEDCGGGLNEVPVESGTWHNNFRLI